MSYIDKHIIYRPNNSTMNVDQLINVNNGILHDI